MRISGFTLCALFAATSLFGGTPSASKGSAGFDKMKSLEGTWEGSDPDGKTVRVSYKTVSAGTAVQETIDHNGMEGAMISMYHLDGERLMMTHYCSAGNQPRMRLTSGTPSSLSFEMFDATNHASKDDLIMNRLIITWVNDTHITEAWTARVKGKDSVPHLFRLARKS